MTALDLVDRFNRQTAMSQAMSRFMGDYDRAPDPRRLAGALHDRRILA